MTQSGNEDRGRLGADSESVAHRLVDAITTHAIFKLDAVGRVETWSDASSALYGFDAADVLGEHVEVLFADTEEPTPDMVAVLAESTDEAQEVAGWNRRADGSIFWATLTLSPLFEDGSSDSFDGHAVVAQDRTESRQYEQMLERQNDRIKEFTDIIAHDLRNPLSVIDGRLELYRDTRDDAHITYIEETTDRMERLVDDLLRVARQGEVVADPEPTDLEDVVIAAWEGTGRPSDDATLIYEAVPTVGADNDRLLELFENLFRNSVEHGGSDVTVRVGPLEGGFFVADDGPGIPADFRDDVFDHGFTTSDDGSGYGLSIVRTIGNAHGWDASATEGPDDGARFEFTGVTFLE